MGGAAGAAPVPVRGGTDAAPTHHPQARARGWAPSSVCLPELCGVVQWRGTQQEGAEVGPDGYDCTCRQASAAACLGPEGRALMQSPPLPASPWLSPTCSHDWHFDEMLQWSVGLRWVLGAPQALPGWHPGQQAEHPRCKEEVLS